MQPDASHITRIMVVSNTHWDREFRRSFEKTRRRLLTMMDITLRILEQDPTYHSFTLDGHSILVDDYLEMRPEQRPLVERLVRTGRLVIGPWYTLAEEFSIGHEALLRNFLYGAKTVASYGGTMPSVAYTPSSWGQTGQLPQILKDFGQEAMMFYRGVSHHECDAEWVWAAPDGSTVLASRFALYARYNWYYQVHRAVTQGKTFSKDWQWGVRDEVPFRYADGLAGEDLTYDLLDPEAAYDSAPLAGAIEDMVAAEGAHFTTPIFLAMNGHDISVAHPREPQVIRDAQALLAGRFTIEHTDLQHYWAEMKQVLDLSALPVLRGERRSYLKEGKWTYLFPGTISARTYLKQRDHDASTRLGCIAEPLASLATWSGASYPVRYLDRAWRMLLSNHTHDANGGCAPDAAHQDMEYRYRNVADIADIVTEDAMAHIAKNLSPIDVPKDALQVIVYNPLPVERDAVMRLDLEVPRLWNAQAVALSCAEQPEVERQMISAEKSSSLVDSIWDVPCILTSNRILLHAHMTKLPALGWRTYRVQPDPRIPRDPRSLITGGSSMENEHLTVQVNGNGTIDLTCRATGRVYRGLNRLLDQGECGNAWKHVAPRFDRRYSSEGLSARIQVIESGPLLGVIRADFEFQVPADYADGLRRSETLVTLPVSVEYRLAKGSRQVEVVLNVDNRAKDHWLRAVLPTRLAARSSVADSHYDVVSREIAIPDSTGWIEAAGGTHPLRSFVALSDGHDGLALLSKGLFEYEAFDDAERGLALTLIRACRIKLAVSEEKQTELPDEGIQCLGRQRFEYAIHVHAGDWRTAALITAAAAYNTPLRAVCTGRGKGTLPLSASLITLDNPNLLVTAVKQGEDGTGLVIRLFNPDTEAAKATLTFATPVRQAEFLTMNETTVRAAASQGRQLPLELGAKKIVTVRVVL
jgi:mannosylglycerate hydrolase